MPKINLIAVCVVMTSMTFLSPASAQSDSTLAASALKAFQSSDWPAAIAAYQNILEKTPGNGGAWYRLGMAHHQSKEYTKSIPAFKMSDSLGVGVAASRYNIASGYSQLQEVESALRWLGQAIDAGFSRVASLESDADLDNVRDHAEFQSLVEKAKRNAKPCLYDKTYSVMDFWLGEWDVYVNGRIAGYNKITKVSDGCALLEDWTSAQGTTGMSINFYDPAVSKWKQTWVGGFVGEYVEISHAEGEILFGYSAINAEGEEVLNRLLFKLQDDGSVRQLFTASTDGGETWQPSFDGKYVKREEE